MLERGRLHLLRQQFLIDQSIEHGPAIIVRELAEGAAAEQSFIAQRIVPIALQNDVPVHCGDDAVDHLPARCGRQIRRSDHKSERQRPRPFSSYELFPSEWLTYAEKYVEMP